MGQGPGRGELRPSISPTPWVDMGPRHSFLDVPRPRSPCPLTPQCPSPRGQVPAAPTAPGSPPFVAAVPHVAWPRWGLCMGQDSQCPSPWGPGTTTPPRSTSGDRCRWSQSLPPAPAPGDEEGKPPGGMEVLELGAGGRAGVRALPFLGRGGCRHLPSPVGPLREGREGGSGWALLPIRASLHPRSVPRGSLWGVGASPAAAGRALTLMPVPSQCATC